MTYTEFLQAWPEVGPLLADEPDDLWAQHQANIGAEIADREDEQPCT